MNKLLTAFYLFHSSRNFIGPVLLAYLLFLGVPLQTIAIAKAIQLVVSVIANVPAGIFANRLGNKFSVIISCIFAILYYIIIIIDPTPTNIIIAEIFNGLSIAFFAGSSDAWLLKFESKNSDSYSLISRGQEIIFATMIVAGAIGTYIFEKSFFVAIIIMITAIFAFLYSEEPQKRPPKTTSYKLDNIKPIMILVITISGSMQLIFQFWPLYFQHKNIGIETQWLGAFFGTALLIQYITTKAFRKMEINKKEDIEIKILSVLIFLSIIVIYGVSNAMEFNSWNKYFFTALFALFASLSSILGNIYLSQAADLHTNENTKSSYLSWLDAGARFFGATLLGVISLLNIKDIYTIWLFFPLLFIVLIIATRKYKNESHKAIKQS